MRILFTVHQFLPDYFSGTEILTLQTARHLRSLGHDTAVFTGFPVRTLLEDSERFDSYMYDDIPVERFHHSSVPMGGQSNIVEAEYNNLLFAKYFSEYLARSKPDIVHCFHLGRLSASAIGVCLQMDIPVVFTATDFWTVCPMSQLRLPDNSLCTGPDKTGVNCLRHIVELTQPHSVRSALERLPDQLLALILKAVTSGFAPNWRVVSYIRALYNRPEFIMRYLNKVSHVTVSTKLMANILVMNGLKRDKLLHIPFGIEYGHIPRSIKQRSERPLRLGFIGTLSEHKGPHVAVQAVRSLPVNIPVELSLYGNPKDFPEYSEQLTRLAANDPRIVFAGTFPNQRIGEVLESVDVLVVPSLWHENTPLVIHSAQAAGCPVVASDLGGISEIIQHGENGLLFRPGSVQELAAHIQQLVNDQNLLPKISAQAFIPKSSSKYAAELLNIYHTVLARKIPPSVCTH